jgi:hypothetical protein
MYAIDMYATHLVTKQMLTIWNNYVDIVSFKL